MGIIWYSTQISYVIYVLVDPTSSPEHKRVVCQSGYHFPESDLPMYICTNLDTYKLDVCILIYLSIHLSIAPPCVCISSCWWWLMRRCTSGRPAGKRTTTLGSSRALELNKNIQTKKKIILDFIIYICKELLFSNCYLFIDGLIIIRCIN